MEKSFQYFLWQNSPSTNTPLGQVLLNRLNNAINTIDDLVITMDATKLEVATANSMVANIDIDTKSGVITVTQLDGRVMTWDLNLEKIPARLAMTEDALLIMETDDGEMFTADLKGLIDTYIFDDSDTIGFSQTVEGDGKHVKAILKNGSVTREKLHPDYLSEIELNVAESAVNASNAADSATESRRYAVGGVEDGDLTDNAKYYAEQAENAYRLAQSIAAINYPSLQIDMVTGHLVSSGGSGITFRIDDAGHLISEVK